MACNWLMVTSSGENNWPSGPGVWVCSPTKLTKKNNKPKAEQENAQPTAARFNIYKPHMVSLNINYMQAKEQEWVTAETNINFEVRSPKGSLKIFLGNSLGLYHLFHL